MATQAISEQLIRSRVSKLTQRLTITETHKFPLQVSCNGDEERITDCEHLSDHDCSVGEAAGVICDTRTEDEEQVQELSCFTTGMEFYEL